MRKIANPWNEMCNIDYSCGERKQKIKTGNQIKQEKIMAIYIQEDSL